MAFLNPKKLLVHAHISPGMFVADFEPGGGFFALEAAKHLYQDGKLYAIGSNHDLLERIAAEAKRHKLETVEVLAGHIERDRGVPLKNGILDLVIIANVFFTVDKKDATAREAYRLLHKGGRVLLVEWLDSFNGLGPKNEHIVPRDQAVKYFKDAGFELMKEIDAEQFHYAYMFQKRNS